MVCLQRQATLSPFSFKPPFPCLFINKIEGNIKNYRLESLKLSKISNKYHLNKEGLDMLMMVRIKGAIDKLDNSIKKFEDSSSKQAEKMINLTIWIKGLTIALFLLTLFQLIILIKQVFLKNSRILTPFI